MRNLKRVLSLGLASIMLISMMAMGAGAANKTYKDLTDKDKIKNQEAVSLLVDLGIVEGKTDGSYDPTGIVDKATMAKLITFLMMGNVDQNSFVGTSTPLTDIAGNWAEGYIKYCYANGIISGDNNNKYNPTASVTVVEAAKMLNVAIGYKAEKQGYVNSSNWSTNIMGNAATSGITNGVASKSTDKLDRDTVALMMYNSLFAKEVYYVDLAGSSPMYKTSWMGLTQYGVVKAQGTITGVSTGKTTLKMDSVANKDSFDVFNTVSDATSCSKTFDLQASPFDIGKTGTIYVTVKTTTGAGGNWLTNTTVATGTVTKVLSSSVVVTDTTLGSATDGTNLGKLTDQNDAKYIADLDKAVTYYALGYTMPTAINAKGTVPTASDHTTAQSTAANKTAGGYYYYNDQLLMKWSYNKTTTTWAETASAAGYGLGTKVALADNDGNGKADAVIITRYAPSVVKSYSTKDSGLITFKNYAGDVFDEIDDDTDWTSKNVVGFSDVKKGDVVMGLKYAPTKTLYLEPTTNETGKVTKVSNDPSKYTMNGETYQVCAVTTTGASWTDPELGAQLTFSLDSYGYVVSTEELEAANDSILYVIEAGSVNFGVQQAKVAFSDGTQSVVSVVALGGNDVTASNKAATDKIYSYTEDDGQYGLTLLGAGGNTKYSYDSSFSGTIAKGVASTVGGAKTNDDTIYVDVVNKSSTTGYRNVSNRTVTTAFSIIKNGSVVAMFISDGTGTANAKDMFTIYKAGKYDGNFTEGNAKYYVMKAIVNGEITTVTVSETVFDVIDDVNGIYIPTTSKTLSDGTVAILTVDGAKTVPSDSGAYEATYCKGSVLAANSTNYTLTSDTLYFVIDTGAGSAKEGDRDSITVKDTNVVPNVTGSSVIVVTADGEINEIGANKTANAAYVYIIK